MVISGREAASREAIPGYGWSVLAELLVVLSRRWDKVGENQERGVKRA
jgi:hypothetical protein